MNRTDEIARLHAEVDDLQKESLSQRVLALQSIVNTLQPVLDILSGPLNCDDPGGPQGVRLAGRWPEVLLLLPNGELSVPPEEALRRFSIVEILGAASRLLDRRMAELGEQAERLRTEAETWRVLARLLAR